MARWTPRGPGVALIAAAAIALPLAANAAGTPHVAGVPPSYGTAGGGASHAAGVPPSYGTGTGTGPNLDVGGEEPGGKSRTGVGMQNRTGVGAAPRTGTGPGVGAAMANPNAGGAPTPQGPNLANQPGAASLLNGTGVGKTPGAAATPPGPAETLAPTAMRQAQQALNSTGASLQVDGLMGPRTRQAIRTYQRNHHLPVTGTLDNRTRQRLNVP